MKKKCIVVISLIIILLAAGLYGWHKLSYGASDDFPDVQMEHMVMEQGETKKLQRQGHPVGADYMYNWDGGHMDHHYIPSLHGVWQLDEPYAQSTIRANGDIEYISLTCTQETIGGFSKRPHNIYAVRFDQSVVSAAPGTCEDWANGEEAVLEKHGKSYHLMNPQINSVYVVRTVWDHGVLEHAWLIVEE